MGVIGSQVDAEDISGEVLPVARLPTRRVLQVHKDDLM